MYPPAALSLVWDLQHEPLTLGGALVLRMEAEWLSQDQPDEPVALHLLGADPNLPGIARCLSDVFATSARRFELRIDPPPADHWPTPAQRTELGFSCFSFSRLLEFGAIYPQLKLAWSDAVSETAARLRRRFPAPLVCVHLRRVPPFASEESNADPIAWADFLAAHAQSRRASFLLLGDDPPPIEVALGANVVRAADLGLPLGLQLSLIAQADGYLGMASGLGMAASFSTTPHVIFKHPEHHAAAMQRELGPATRFPFASPKQQLWRRPADRAALDDALNLILSP